MTVNSGTFALNGFSQTIGDFSGSGATTLGSSASTVLTVDQMSAGPLLYSGLIFGSGGLTKAGTGILELTGLNSYMGQTTVTGGTLELNAMGGPAIASSSILVNGGTLLLERSDQINSGASITVQSGAFDLNGFSQVLGEVQLLGGSIDGPGTLTNNTTNFDLQNGAVSASLAGSVGLDKSTSGIVTLTGVNTYTGTTMVSGGILNLNSGGVALSGTTAVQITGGTLTLQSSNQINPVTILTVNGSAAVFNLGVNSQTFGGVHLLNGSIAGTGTLTDNTSNFDLQNGFVSASLVGNVGLDKSTSGIVTLTGVNTYTGTTTVSGGILNLNSGGVALSGTTDVQITGGTLTLQNSNQINPAAILTVNEAEPFLISVEIRRRSEGCIFSMGRS